MKKTDFHHLNRRSGQGRAGRSCGTCNLCCTVIGVTELEKPANQKCCHLSTLGQCSIYRDRPTSCREFNCQWLQGFVPENLFPAKVRVVVYEMKELHGRRVLYIHVPKEEPGAWQRGQFRMWLQSLIEEQWLIIVVGGDDRKLLGHGAEEFVLTATGEAE